MNNAKALIGDPVYQVNLVLWFSLPRPVDATLPNPIFVKAGYSLYSVEQPLHLPLKLASRVKSSGLVFRDPVSPDALLTNKDIASYLTVECKSSMFGAEPHKSDGPQRQSRSLLLQIPEVLTEALAQGPSTISSNHVLYLTRHREVDCVITEGLSTIADELSARGFKVTDYGVVGLDVTDDAIVLRHGYPRSTLPMSVDCQFRNAFVVVQQFDVDTDPRPLYFIPWIPDSESHPDEYARISFAHRIFSEAVMRIGPIVPPLELILNMDDLLVGATQGVWEYWHNNDNCSKLRRIARDHLRNALRRIISEQAVRLINIPYGLELNIPDEKVQIRIIEGLRKIDSTGWYKPEQLELFNQEQYL